MLAEDAAELALLEALDALLELEAALEEVGSSFLTFTSDGNLYDKSDSAESI